MNPNQPLPSRLLETALWLRTAASQIVKPASVKEEWLDRARACEEAARELVKHGAEPGKAYRVKRDREKLKAAACGKSTDSAPTPVRGSVQGVR